MGEARRFAAPALIAAGAICLLIGQFTLYADRELFDSRSFANRAAQSLTDPRVREAVSVRVTEVVVNVTPDAIAYQPLISGVVDGVMSTSAFQGMFNAAAYDIHQTLFRSSKSTVTLTLADIGVLITDVLKRISPEVAEKIPADLRANLLRISTEGAAVVPVDLARIASRARWIAITSLLFSLALFGLAIALTRPGGRRRALSWCGLAVAGVGIASFALLELLLWIGVPLAAGADQAAATRGVLDAFLGTLRVWSLVLAGSGVIVASAASALIRPVDLSETFGRISAAVTATPATRGRRALRALGLIALGVLLVTLRHRILSLVGLAIGLGVLYVGVAELLRLWLPPAGDERPADEPLMSPRRVRVFRAAITATLMVVLVGGVVVLSIAANVGTPKPLVADGCNDSKALCELSLSEVTLPATHNSMAAASEGWLFAGQTYGIRRQLEDGIRGLLIDTHYGFQTPRGVATDLDNDPESRAKIADELGDEFVETAQRLRARLGYQGQARHEVFLCHAYCELGATQAAKALSDIKEFLVANPSEVIVISIEDGVTPSDTAEEFQRSGLIDYVYRGPIEPLPTLGEMVEKGQRVLVMGESTDGSVPWLHPQYDGLVQETPYEFDSVDELLDPVSCRPHRGEASGPLLLVNNWIETTPAPRATNAEQANAHELLIERAARCESARETPVSLLAVDFYDRGNVVGAARDLNQRRLAAAAP